MRFGPVHEPNHIKRPTPPNGRYPELPASTTMMAAASTSSSDFHQWLHAMKMVARLPGGMPPEFRRKLWLALAEQHLQTKAIDWSKEEPKCMCEEHGEDDEELGIQIVKVLSTG